MRTCKYKACPTECPISDENCPVRRSLAVIGGKWPLLIVFQIGNRTLRFAELRRHIPAISPLYRLDLGEAGAKNDKNIPMVSHVDTTWNSFLPYLINLTDKLEDLGFRYVDNKVIVLKEDLDDK